MLCRIKRNVRNCFTHYFLLLLVNEIEIEDADDRLCNMITAEGLVSNIARV